MRRRPWTLAGVWTAAGAADIATDACFFPTDPCLFPFLPWKPVLFRLPRRFCLHGRPPTGRPPPSAESDASVAAAANNNGASVAAAANNDAQVTPSSDRPPSSSHPSFAEQGGSGGVRDLRSSGRRPQRRRGGRCAGRRRAVRRPRHLGVVVGARGDGRIVIVGDRGHGCAGLGRRGGRPVGRPPKRNQRGKRKRTGFHRKKGNRQGPVGKKHASVALAAA